MNRLSSAGTLLAVLVATSTLLAACSEPATQYVALGDSYTGAPGVGKSSDRSGCHRSKVNYPHLLAEERDLELNDVSCGSAWTNQATGPQKTSSGREVEPQLEAVAKDTELVTVGLGGNDEGLVPRVIFQCTAWVAAEEPPGDTPCTTKDKSFGKTSTDAILTRLPDKLVDLYHAIRKRAPKATIVAVGYPQIFPESGNCSDLPIPEGDIPWANDVLLDLNQAIEDAAKETGITYLDVYAASKGHHICSADPWIAGDRNQPGKAAAYHPLAAEQELVADLLDDLLDELAKK